MDDEDDVTTHRVALICGDGIGPEVVAAAREVLDATGVALEWEVVDIGARALAAGHDELVPIEARDAMRACRVVLKGPLSTVDPPRGPRSPNVALRKALDLVVQVRRIRSVPGARALAHDLDLTLARVMTEDLNEGVEYPAGTPRARELAAWLGRDGFAVSHEAAFSVKPMSSDAVRRAAALACTVVRAAGVTRITIAHKASIMRATDGLFRDAAASVLDDRPDLEHDEMLVDDVAATLVRHPARLRAVLTSNLYGDVLSSVAAGLAGGVGLLAGATYGEDVVVFEAGHGTAPKYEGADRANPCGAVLAGALLLRRLGEDEAASRVEQAVEGVVRDGVDVTADLVAPGWTHVGTQAMARAIATRVLDPAPNP